MLVFSIEIKLDKKQFIAKYTEYLAPASLTNKFCVELLNNLLSYFSICEPRNTYLRLSFSDVIFSDPK